MSGHERNTRLAARLHWALLPCMGAYYYADEMGEKVPLRWRLGYRLMTLVTKLPGSELYPPLPQIECGCDYCHGVPGAVFEP